MASTASCARANGAKARVDNKTPARNVRGVERMMLFKRPGFPGASDQNNRRTLTCAHSEVGSNNDPVFENDLMLLRRRAVFPEGDDFLHTHTGPDAHLRTSGAYAGGNSRGLRHDGRIVIARPIDPDLVFPRGD